MIKNTTYNLIDTLRFLGGEEQWRKWYNFFQEHNGKDRQDLYTLFSHTFNTKRPVSSIIVDTLIEQDVINSDHPHTKYGIPNPEIILTPQNYLQYLNKTVQFNSNITNGEYDFEPKMKAKIIGIQIREQGTPDEYYMILFDLTDYEEHNDQYMVASYWDKNHQPTLTWKESGFYPKNKKHQEYYSNPMPFEVV